MSGLVELVIAIIVIGLIAWLLIFLVDYIPLPAPFNRVAKVLIMVVSVLILITMLLGLTGTVLPFRRG